MNVIRSLVIAFSTYSRIPMPPVEWSDENRRYAMCFFPMIGVVIGLLAWGWLALSDTLNLNAVLRGAVGALLPLLVTGGIHMDGFMDTCDALGSHQPRERKLEILKDSHAGAFAVMGCVGYLLVLAGLFAELPLRSAPLLVGVFALSRALSALALVCFPSARPGGMLDGFARAAHRRRVSLAAWSYIALSALLWIAAGGLTQGAVALAAAGLCFAYYHGMSERQFGGVTGDLAGWFVQVTELALVAVVALGGRLS